MTEQQHKFARFQPVCPSIAMWNRIECHVTLFMGGSKLKMVPDLCRSQLLLVPGGLRIDNPHFIAGSRHEITRQRVLAISMRGCRAV